MNKIKEKLLKDFKRANKERKLTLANRYGFNTPEEYLALLEDREMVKPLVKPTIHNVILLDNSGSMSGSKFNNAYKGVQEEINILKNTKEADYLYSLFNFTGHRSPVQVINKLPIKEVSLPHMTANTGTPLYDTIILIEKNLLPVDPNVNTLLKIFTDGKDEHSDMGIRQAVKSIKNMKAAGITVTFVGTRDDVAYIVSNLGIDFSNTLVHDNTGKGVEEAFATSMMATQVYTSSVIKGEDVSKGFYKKIVK